MIVLLIGGCGFVGVNLAVALLSEGADVHILDSAPLPQALLGLDVNGGVRYHRGNITEYDFLVDLMLSVQPDMVVHLASYGMSGAPMLNKGMCRNVNVLATGLIVAAMKVASVPNIIYISSPNAVYGGREIVNGDESMDYYPFDWHTDYYGPTKAMAEQAVLDENGNGGIKSCSIRPAAIYGLGEQRHFPRMVSHIDHGIFKFRIGAATVDWVNVDNLTQAIMLTIEKMITTPADGSAVPCGEKYFISDGTPIDNFEFLRPLCEARGEKYPSIVLPVTAALTIGWFFEVLHYISRAVGLPIEPFMTRAEVYKVGVTHYFSIEKAQRELGYSPTMNSRDGAEQMADSYRIGSNHKKDHKDFFRVVGPEWYVPILGGLYACYCVAFDDPASWTRIGGPMYAQIMHALLAVGLAVFRTKFVLALVFYAAVAAHAVEAAYAYTVARDLGCATWPLWVVQTFIFGGPSLTILLNRRKKYA